MDEEGCLLVVKSIYIVTFNVSFISVKEKIMTFYRKVPANLVPAAAVIREGQTMFSMIGRKELVDGFF